MFRTNNIALGSFYEKPLVIARACDLQWLIKGLKGDVGEWERRLEGAGQAVAGTRRPRRARDRRGRGTALQDDLTDPGPSGGRCQR